MTVSWGVVSNSIKTIVDAAERDNFQSLILVKLDINYTLVYVSDNIEQSVERRKTKVDLVTFLERNEFVFGTTHSKLPQSIKIYSDDRIVDSVILKNE